VARDISASEPVPPDPVYVDVADPSLEGDNIYTLEDAEPGAWSTGLASAYGLSNAGTHTANGTALNDDAFGVAVPAAQGYLLGATIEVEYNGIVVRGTINDTGGFGGWGRALDLQGGFWKAFGFGNEVTWGVRYVNYRIIG